MRASDEANVATATYRKIKRRIVELHYGVGERLSEARLASDLKVGRSPVRTALSRLKSEGWIAISPQSGTYVKAMTPRDIRELTELRMLLEMRAAGAAATRMSDSALKTLRADFRLQSRAIAKGNVDAFIALDNHLHAAIYDAADNGLIRQILLDLRDKVQWIRRVCSVSIERTQDGLEELRCILIALERRDEMRAAQAMRDHVQSAAAFCERLEGIADQPAVAGRPLRDVRLKPARFEGYADHGDGT
jgi:DNA-binding GntR family transcriptional regulator